MRKKWLQADPESHYILAAGGANDRSQPNHPASAPPGRGTGKSAAAGAATGRGGSGCGTSGTQGIIHNHVYAILDVIPVEVSSAVL